MYHKNRTFHGIYILGFFLFSILPCSVFAEFGKTNMEVWVNEAIINVYTLDFEQLVAEQKEIAKYFTADGWIGFNKALQGSKLIENIQTNSYSVSAVATMPPTIKQTKANEWEATMPILVFYKNPAYQQKQILRVVVNFIQSADQGVRGFAITRLVATESSPPCKCSKSGPSAAIV